MLTVAGKRSGKWRFFILSHWSFCDRHAIFFVSPAAKVYQLAALGAEGTGGVIFPVNGLPAGRTFHNLVKRASQTAANEKAKEEFFSSRLTLLALARAFK
jgi:hypothetical protein